MTNVKLGNLSPGRVGGATLSKGGLGSLSRGGGGCRYIFQERRYKSGW